MSDDTMEGPHHDLNEPGEVVEEPTNTVGGHWTESFDHLGPAPNGVERFRPKSLSGNHGSHQQNPITFLFVLPHVSVIQTSDKSFLGAIVLGSKVGAG